MKTIAITSSTIATRQWIHRNGELHAHTKNIVRIVRSTYSGVNPQSSSNDDDNNYNKTTIYKAQ